MADDYQSFEEWKDEYVSQGKAKYGAGVCFEFAATGHCELRFMGMCSYKHEAGGKGTKGKGKKGLFDCPPVGSPRARSPRRAGGNSSSAGGGASAAGGSQVFAFGKHKGRTFDEVFRTEKGYVGWALREKEASGGLKAFADYCRAMQEG